MNKYLTLNTQGETNGRDSSNYLQTMHDSNYN